jgi:hypothetical protein
MIRGVAIVVGLVAMGIVSVLGYFTNVSFSNILIRGIISFFLFYTIGNFIGVIIVKNIIDVLERKKAAIVARNRKELREKEADEQKKQNSEGAAKT